MPDSTPPRPKLRVGPEGQLEKFSFFDPEYHRDPHAVLARLRSVEPVHRGKEGWIVTGHEEVTQLNRDPRCGRDTRKLRTGGLGMWFQRHPGLGEFIATAMFHLDPPDHTRIRKLMAYAFTPKAIAQMERSVESVATALLDELPPEGEIELMSAYARPLPVQVICDLMQVPTHDFPQVRAWSDALAEHVEITASAAQLAAADQAYGEFKAYLADFVAERRRTGGDGLVDRLIAAEAETEALSSDELLSNIILLLVAGHETTTNLIGNGMLSLLEHPEQIGRLREDPDLAASAVEECLRFESPANTNARCPHEDIEIGGKVIGKGQLVMCMLGAANRDPRAFDDPDAFDITRSANPHQSFGGGPHFCIGAHLARLEGRIAIRRLLDKYGTIALDRSRVKWRTRINLRGLAELGLVVAP